MHEEVGLSNAFEYGAAQTEESVGVLLDLLRIPSISALPSHASDTRQAAQLTADLLRGAGAENVHLAEPSTGTFRPILALRLPWCEDTSR